MAGQTRRWRTRNLFPRTIALWIQTRRAPHHARLWVRSTVGSPSLWTTSVMAGALAIMMLADWILPFVYNIGFNGFQASLLFWLFLGGVAALDYAGAAEPSSDDGPGDP